MHLYMCRFKPLILGSKEPSETVVLPDQDTDLTVLCEHCHAYNDKFSTEAAMPSNRRRRAKDGALQNTDQRPVRLHCTQCADTYCTRCYEWRHLKGTRVHHKPRDVPYCCECKYQVASLRCLACPNDYCDMCFKAVHAKYGPEEWQRDMKRYLDPIRDEIESEMTAEERAEFNIGGDETGGFNRLQVVVKRGIQKLRQKDQALQALRQKTVQQLKDKEQAAAQSAKKTIMPTVGSTALLPQGSDKVRTMTPKKLLELMRKRAAAPKAKRGHKAVRILSACIECEDLTARWICNTYVSARTSSQLYLRHAGTARHSAGGRALTRSLYLLHEPWTNDVLACIWCGCSCDDHFCGKCFQYVHRKGQMALHSCECIAYLTEEIVKRRLQRLAKIDDEAVSATCRWTLF